MVGFVPGCFSVLGLEKCEGAEGWTSRQQTNQEEPRGSTAKWEPGTAMRGSACHSARQPSRALTRTPGTPGLPLQTINTACFSSASMTWRKRQWFNVRKKKKKSKGGFWHWPDCNCTGGYRRFLLFKTLNRSNYLHFWLYIFTIDFWAMYAACTHIMRLCHLFHHVLQGEENKQMRIIFFFC